MDELQVRIANRYLKEAGDSPEEELPQEDVPEKDTEETPEDVPEETPEEEPEPKEGIDTSDMKEKVDDIDRLMDDFHKALKVLRDKEHDPKSKEAETLQQMYKKVGSLYSTYFQFN
jgi:hypothetical protein